VRFRTRALAASCLLAVGLVAFAPSAMAQDGNDELPPLTEQQMKDLKEIAKQVAEDNGAKEDDAECIEKLLDGKKVDECQEAPSPILPAADEMLWGALSFVILFVLLWKLGYPAIQKMMNDRTERIRGDLDAAEQAKVEATTVLDSYRAQLADARNESARIIEEARQSAEALKREQEARLQAELAETRARAAADIEAAKAHAMADLRGDVAQLAIGAAEVVVGANLDPAAQSQLIEDYINQVASRS